MAGAAKAAAAKESKAKARMIYSYLRRRGNDCGCMKRPKVVVFALKAERDAKEKELDEELEEGNPTGLYTFSGRPRKGFYLLLF